MYSNMFLGNFLAIANKQPLFFTKLIPGNNDESERKYNTVSGHTTKNYFAYSIIIPNITKKKTLV